MRMNVITVKTSDDFNAGGKAPNDIVEILKSTYNCRSTVFENYGSSNNKLIKLFKRIKKTFRFPYEFIKSRIKKEVVVLQFPLFETTKLLNKFLLFSMNFLDYNKTIILIHDLEGIRNKNDILKKQELDRFKKAKYLIVHNDVMKNIVLKDDIKNKIYVLELFDYLCNEKNERKNCLKKEPMIVYAGNLAKVKSPFLHSLETKKMKFKLNVYGVGIDDNINDKIIYLNKYNPNELPLKLKGDLGLIWDGEIDGRDENIGMKCYTKINNPHKLSCYIAASLPVIAWQKSAISHFIKKYNVGYLIDNIYDINNLNLSDYTEKLNNVKKIQGNVINGYYTKKVIDDILDDMKLP